MILKNNFFLRGLFLSLSCVTGYLAPLVAWSQDTPVAELYPFANYKGGFAAYGGTTVTPQDEPPQVSLSSGQQPAFVIWFYSHQLIPKSTVADWGNTELQLEVKSVNGPMTIELSAAWRGAIDPVELGQATKQVVDLGEDFTTVRIPMPESESIPSEKLTGILFKFGRAGDFVVRSINVVNSGSPVSSVAPSAPSSTAVAQPVATPASTTAAPAALAAPLAPLKEQKADVAAVKPKDGQPDPNFMAAHERNVKRTKQGPIGLLFLGDSITSNWGKYKALWEENFGAYQPANFGVGGDCTQHVLWRIQNGELDGINPKAVVLMIGTNNSNYHSPEATALGVKAILDVLREKLPNTKVLLVGVFPRGDKPNPYRAKNEAVNTLIQGYADGSNIFYLDFTDKLMQPDKSITPEMMPDFLHPAEPGYRIWAQAMQPQLAELMK